MLDKLKNSFVDTVSDELDGQGLDLVETIKVTIGYCLVFAILKLIEFGAMALFTSGYQSIAAFDYFIFIIAVSAGIVAEILYYLGIAFIAVLAVTYIVIYTTRLIRFIGVMTAKKSNIESASIDATPFSDKNMPVFAESIGQRKRTFKKNK